VEFNSYLKIRTLAAMQAAISKVIVTYGDNSTKEFNVDEWYWHGNHIIKNLYKKNLCKIVFKNLNMESIEKAKKGMKFGKPRKSKRSNKKSNKDSFENSKDGVNKAEKKDVR
jgi:hypothetical protein